MYLTFDERIDLMIIRYLFSYKTENISINLQRINDIKIVFRFPQKSIEKDTQNVD